ncbi:hypothetical protein WJX64_16150 [Leifsonia sp. YIM 134122]|uniref:Fimbrial assembly protein n=1 Tax=Leifsonia stereocauli TaxID=3134136 RepID=A0ABU9W7V6_9MICO
MSTIAQGRDVLVIGGLPSVDLMPPEVRAQKAGKILRGRLGLGVALVAVVTVAGVALATVAAINAEISHAAAQATTVGLLAQQNQYAAARAAQQGIQTGHEAQRVIGGTEVDWQSYLASATAALPAGTVMSEFSIDSATPMVAYPQSADPLQTARVATLRLVGTSAVFGAVPDMLDNLAKIPGVIDTQFGPSTRNDDGTYKTTVEMHLDETAYAGRFEPKDGE